MRIYAMPTYAVQKWSINDHLRLAAMRFSANLAASAALLLPVIGIVSCGQTVIKTWDTDSGLILPFSVRRCEQQLQAPGSACL